MDRDLIQRFARIFRGLDRAYGAVNVSGKSESSGKKKATYTIVREPRTMATFEAHLTGERGIGVVPINEENECRWGAIDIDTYPLDHAEVIKQIKTQELPLVTCRSKSGGAHLYLFLSEPLDAEKLQTKLKEITAELGYASNTEIFPKQVKLVLERGDTGNFLNLPYFNAETGLRYAFNADGSAATLEEFLAMAEAAMVTEAQLDELLTVEASTVDQRLKNGPPCLQALLRQGFPQGTRNNGLFNIGVYLRKAFPDEWETKILEYNQSIMLPPLDLQEMNAVAAQIKKKDYQYKCADQPIRGFCNKDLCRSRKYGVGGGANTPTVANLRKYDSEPPLWFLDVNGNPVELDTEALQAQSRFQLLCMEQINFMPRTVPRPAWEAQMHQLLSSMVQTEGAIINTSDDTSIRGQFYDLLEEFTTHMQAALDKEEILLRRPWTDEETNRTYFRLKDLEAFLKRNKFFEYKSNKIAQRLRDMEGNAEQFRIKGRTVRCWSIPSFAKVEGEFASRFDEEDVPF
jgi:hypothetical protein